MNKIVQFFAEVQSITTRVDRSLKIVFETQEVDDSLASSILSTRHKAGFVVFAEQNIRAEELDIPEEVPEFKGEKSPSQRLRNVLYRVWEKNPGVKTFESWRADEMERIIEHYKGKLD